MTVPSNQAAEPNQTGGGPTPAASGPVLESAAGIKAWTGMIVVIFGDVAIALAAVIGIAYVSTHANSSAATVSIITSAFTAIGTMTTAYFGIRSMSNTAQTSIANANS
jgi:hypothetical protein